MVGLMGFESPLESKENKQRNLPAITTFLLQIKKGAETEILTPSLTSLCLTVTHQFHTNKSNVAETWTL